MSRARLGWLLASTLLVLGGCKSKSSGEGPVAATTPGAAQTAEPAPTAPPAPTSLSSLMSFEGEIDMTAKGSDPGKPAQPLNMLVKGDKVRVDVLPGTEAANALGKGYLLVRVADKKFDLVVESKKQVVELDMTNPDLMKSLQKASPGPTAHAKPEPPPKLTKTGTKETIAGYSCEDWEVTSGKENKKKASFCVASLPSAFFHLPLTGLPGEYGFASELIDGQHFPLRAVGYDEHTGAESGRLEVTKLDQHPIDAAKFEIPAGYQLVDMAQFIMALSGGHVPGMPSGLPGMPEKHPHHPHR